MTRISLVGTAHTDPYLVRNVSRALIAINPNFVTVERNPNKDYQAAGIQFFAKIIDGLVKRGRHLTNTELKVLDKICLDAMYQQEWTAVEKYCQKSKIPYEAIDLLSDECNAYNASIRHMIEQILPQDSLTSSPTQTQLRMFREQKVLSIYAQAREMFNDRRLSQQIVNDARQNQVIGERDRVMAQKIEKIIQISHPARLVHVGGAFHMLNDLLHETLYERLTAHNPARSLVCDYT